MDHPIQTQNDTDAPTEITRRESGAKLSNDDIAVFIELHNNRIALQKDLAGVIENLKKLSPLEKERIREEAVDIREDYENERKALEGLFHEQLRIYSDIEKKEVDKLNTVVDANKLVQEELHATGTSTIWIQKRKEIKDIDNIMLEKGARTKEITKEAKKSKISILELNEKSQISLQLHILVEKIDQDLL